MAPTLTSCISVKQRLRFHRRSHCVMGVSSPNTDGSPQSQRITPSGSSHGLKRWNPFFQHSPIFVQGDLLPQMYLLATRCCWPSTLAWHRGSPRRCRLTGRGCKTVMVSFAPWNPKNQPPLRKACPQYPRPTHCLSLRVARQLTVRGFCAARWIAALRSLWREKWAPGRG